MPTFLAESHFCYILSCMDIFWFLSNSWGESLSTHWIFFLLVVILWWMFMREKIGSPAPNLLMKRFSHTPFLLLCIWIIRIILFGLLFLLFSRTWTSSLQEEPKNPEEAAVIVLDISKSMETDDLNPSRIEYAKNIILDYGENLRFVGVIIFAGKTFILSPITADNSGIRYLIETLSTDTINQNENETSGTNIGDSLIQASTLFPPQIKEKKIILITDGRANTGLDPLIAAEALHEKQIQLSAIALGSASGIALNHLVDGRREPLLDSSGNTINGSVDIPTLSEITQITEGKLLHISSSSDNTNLESIFGEKIPSPSRNPPPLMNNAFFTLLIAFFAILHLIVSFVFWGRYKSR
ncbi:MAG: VWA domain-containing protein [Candidatus Altimarinota bacterium]